MSRVTSAPILPAAVAAAHFESCAAELARATHAGADEMAEIMPVLVRAQRQLATALDNLSRHTDGHPPGKVTRIDLSAPVSELTEVLTAASDAAEATADALEEALPLLESPGTDDTRS